MKARYLASMNPMAEVSFCAKDPKVTHTGVVSIRLVLDVQGITVFVVGKHAINGSLMKVVHEGPLLHRSDTLPQLPVSRLVGHDGPIGLIRFTADGKYCFTGCHDRTVRLWNPARLDPAVHPSLLSVAKEDGNGDVPLEGLPHALPIHTYEVRHAPSALATNTDVSTSSSPTRSLLVASDRTGVLFDVVTTQVLRRFQGHHTSVINSVAIAGEDINVFATGSYDATVALWDGRSHSPRPIQILKDAKDSVTVVNFLKGNTKIRSASVDGCVRTYDIRNGCVCVDDYGSPITGITRTDIDSLAEQYVAVSCLDGTIRVHIDRDDERGSNIERGGIMKHPALICSGHVAGQYALEVSFTADGGSVVTGSQDGRAVLYDVRRLSKFPPSRAIDPASPLSPHLRSASMALALVGHTCPTCSIATNPMVEYNDVMITASYDGQAVVWANSREYMKWEA